ncbi:MAG TPA: SatD family protein [Bacillota bacterium]
MPVYWAVIGDIVHSRALKDRAAWQQRLEAVLVEADQRFAAGLAAGWTLTLGDEFQALYRAPDAIPPAVEWLLGALHPARLRFGVGHGTLATELKPRAVGMDGPVFHAARLALDHAKRKGKLVTAAEPNEIMRLPTDIWDLAVKVAGGRTAAQRRVIDRYRKLRNQYRTAAALGVTQGTVSAHLARAMFFETEAVLTQVTALLKAAGQRGAG